MSTPPRSDHNIWPAIFSDEPLRLRRWLADLGFQEGIVVPGDEEGRIAHSEMRWPEGGRVMIASKDRAADNNASHGGTAGLYVVCDDPDSVHRRAQTLGATITRPLEDQQDYDSRGFSVLDPDGNSWSFGTYAG